MGNYTTLELEVVIKPECRERIKKLDDWLHESAIYNPTISPNYAWYDQPDGTDIYKLVSGESISLPVYPDDLHPFFKARRVNNLLGLGKSEKWNWDTPIWSYDKTNGLLVVRAYFRNYYGQLNLFFDWLSPLVLCIQEGEFNTDDDLEGPRHVKLVNQVLTIDQWSFTRGEYR